MSPVATAPDEVREPPLLAVQDLAVSFHGRRGTVEAVHGVSFAVHPGEVVALVGESGSGKSVTARSLVGLAGRGATVGSTRLQIGGRDVRSLSDRAWRSIRGVDVGFVLQDALVSLDPLRTIGREIAEPLLTHRLLPRRQVPERVEQLLGEVGIPDARARAHQYSHELSGGLRQRALIASALATGPRLLIADEPTTALDVTVQAQVLRLLPTLVDSGRGLLLITHDLAVVASIADRVLVMSEGEVVESGTARQVLTAPTAPQTRALLASVPSPATKGRLLTTGAPLPETDRTPGTADGAAARPLLQVTDVSVTFPDGLGGRRTAVDDVSLSIAPGETLGIVGESGSGKTTVGRVVLGLQRPDEGTVLLDSEPWSDLPERARRGRRHRVQLIAQDPISSFDPQFTVGRIVGQPLLRQGGGAAQRRREVVRLLDSVGLPEDFLLRTPSTLSGGQRQRVAIARALASRPELIVADEPVSALDVTTQAQVLDLLGVLQRQTGVALLFISHDLGVVHHVSDRVLVMQHGRVVEQGDVDRIFNDPHEPYTQALLRAVPRIEESHA